MRVLVSGGAGFIGSHSVRALLAAGHQAVALDDLSGGDPSRLPDAAELIVADVRDPEACAAAVAGCDAVLHLAALVSVPQSLEQPELTFAVNTAGTTTLLEAARRAGVGRFVLASTCAVYGDLPGVKDEAAPVAPLSPYAASKLMAEQALACYSRCYGMATAILRYFNVYGPGQPANSPYSGVIARWAAAALAGALVTVNGDGGQSRDFVSVHDVARANLLALGGPVEPGGVYNVATGRSASLNELLDGLEQARGGPLERRYGPERPGDIRHSAGRSERLQGLGWRPAVGLGDGLAELLTARP